MISSKLENRGGSTRLDGWAWCLLVLLAIIPSFGTLGAPWIAEDASILARVARPGIPGDWLGPQYGVEYVVRFWRPVVTLSWWMGQRLFGVDPVFLRLFNVGAHMAVVLLVARILCVLGVRPAAVLLGAAAAALFPQQGGTVTWLAGRTDPIVAFWMSLALLASLTDRRWASAGLTVVACASKEFAFLLPVWVSALQWARTRSWEGIPRAALPVLGAAGLAFLWRWVALGAWDGGYVGGGGAFFQGLSGALPNFVRALGPTPLAVLALGALGAFAGCLDGRLFAAGWVLAGSAALPLVPLTMGAELEPQNLRLLFVPELGLCLSAAAALARTPRKTAPARLAGILSLVFLGWRGWSASLDTHEWAHAAHLGEERIEAARRRVADRPRSARPVFFAGFPTEHAGAYCLGLGVADRFRPPFEESPRPIWPLRPLWELGKPGEAERRPARELDPGGVLWPWEARPILAELPFDADFVDVEKTGALMLDERVLQGGPDRSVVLTLDLGAWGADHRIEAVVYTELGYGSALVPECRAGGSERLTLRSILESSTPVATVGQMLMHAADLGFAREAYLELRCVDGEGKPVAATSWIPLGWEQGFLRRVLAGP